MHLMFLQESITISLDSLSELCAPEKACHGMNLKTNFGSSLQQPLQQGLRTPYDLLDCCQMT